MRLISPNPGSMEAGKCGLTRGICSAARRLELVAVAGRLWNSWCVLGGAGFFRAFFSIFFLRTHTACCMYEATLCLTFCSTSTGVRTECHYLVSLSVYPCVYLFVCVTFVVFTDYESCTRPISTNPGSMEAGECGLTRATCFAARRLELVAVAGRLRISWRVFGGVGFFLIFFSPNAHGLLQV